MSFYKLEIKDNKLELNPITNVGTAYISIWKLSTLIKPKKPINFDNVDNDKMVSVQTNPMSLCFTSNDNVFYALDRKILIDYMLEFAEFKDDINKIDFLNYYHNEYERLGFEKALNTNKFTRLKVGDVLNIDDSKNHYTAINNVVTKLNEIYQQLYSGTLTITNKGAIFKNQDNTYSRIGMLNLEKINREGSEEVNMGLVRSLDIAITHFIDYKEI